jgi:hypothetical protein
MSNNFFSQDPDIIGDDTFTNMPDEVQEGISAPPVEFRPQAAPSASAPARTPVAATPTLKAEYLEDMEIEESEEEDYSEVLNDARLRLEQGRLYELIMNHDLFSGSDADPKAIKHVQREIRNFAKERMEIMLGMRRETSQVEHLEIDFPFNAAEVEVLKKLAFTATKGASQNADRYVPDVKKTIEEIPLLNKRTSLNPIGSAKSKQKNASLPSKPSSPMSRAKNDAIDRILAEEGVTREELEKTFNPNYKPLDKHPSQLTPDEIVERNKRASVQKTVPSTHALPMPTDAHMEAMYTQRAQAAGANPQMQAIMTLLTKK